MASRKRAATGQLTRDNQDDDSDGEVPEFQKMASAEKMAQRKVIKVKRTASSSSSSAPVVKGAFTLADDLGAEEKKEEKKEEPKKEEKKPEPAAANPWAAFLPKPGSWDCPSCSLNNKKEATKCISCETPNPNAPAEEAAPAQDDTGGVTFGFGVPDSAASSSSSTDAAAAAPTTTETSAVSSDSGFSSGFSFTDSSSFGFSAGGAQISFDSAGSDSTFANTTADSGATESETKVETKGAEATGEEKDQTLLKVRSKVFIFKKVPKITKESALPKDDDDEGKSESSSSSSSSSSSEAAGGEVEMEQKYVEAGVGDLKVNKFTKDDGKIGARLVLRAEKIHRLVMNAPIFVGMKFNVQNDKNIRIQTLGLEGKMEIHLLKFRNKDETDQVFKQIEDLITELKAQQ